MHPLSSMTPAPAMEYNMDLELSESEVEVEDYIDVMFNNYCTSPNHSTTPKQVISDEFVQVGDNMNYSPRGPVVPSGLLTDTNSVTSELTNIDAFINPLNSNNCLPLNTVFCPNYTPVTPSIYASKELPVIQGTITGCDQPSNVSPESIQNMSEENILQLLASIPMLIQNYGKLASRCTDLELKYNTVQQHNFDLELKYDAAKQDNCSLRNELSDLRNMCKVRFNSGEQYSRRNCLLLGLPSIPKYRGTRFSKFIAKR